MKKVTCSICNQEVTKRSTVSVGDGKRACRSHEGVDEKSAKEQSQLKAKNEAVADNRSRWKRPLDEHDPVFQPKCFSCRKAGIRQQEYFLRILVLGEKYEITYGKPLNPFDAEEVKKAYSEIKEQVCLWYVEYDPAKIHLDYNCKMAAQIMGMVLLCPKCCDKFNINPSPVGDMDLEQISRMGCAYEVFVRPGILSQAKDEIEQNN